MRSHRSCATALLVVAALLLPAAGARPAHAAAAREVAMVLPSRTPPAPAPDGAPPQPADTLGALDGVSRYDTPRMLGLKRRAGPRPRLAETPARCRVEAARMPGWASAPGAALQAAADSARRIRGCHRLVLLPNGARVRVALVLRANADTAYDITVASAHAVTNDTTLYARGLRVPAAPFAEAPLLETVDRGASAQAQVVATARGAAVTGWRLVGVQLRLRAGLRADQFAYYLVGHGTAEGDFNDPRTAPGGLVLDHVWLGGRKFDASGRWLRDNLVRAVYDYGGGFALLDSYAVEIGSAQGSDGGIYSAPNFMGPTWIANNGTDLGGGIAYFVGGGAPHVAGYRNADVEVAYNHLQWAITYHPTLGLRDAAGKTAPWALKNQGESKRVARLRWWRNVAQGRWNAGQSGIWLFRHVDASGGGAPYAAHDLLVAENVAESHPTAGQDVQGIALTGDPFGWQRVTIRGNYVRADTRLLELGTGGEGATLTLSRDLVVADNLLARWPGSSGGTELLTGGRTGQRLGGRFVFRGNVSAYGAPYGYRVDKNGGYHANGFEGWLVGSQLFAGAALDVRDNVRASHPDGPPLEQLRAADGRFAAAQRYVAGGALGDATAALGLASDASGFLRWTSTSPLRGMGQGGTRVGPDLDLLARIRTAVVAGDVRAFRVAGEF